MSWQFVYNGRNLLAGTHIDDASKMCKNAGYQFLLFNGRIYFVDDNSSAITTEITIDDLV